jgi:endo-1,3-1,4-beta-glycanase ExoK
MATRSSSRATTPTERRRSAATRIVQFATVALIALALPGAASAGPGRALIIAGDSFFEPFDRLDPLRWYISDGWSDGAFQACTFSRSNLRVAGGMLDLRLTRAPERPTGFACPEIRTYARLGYGTYEARIRTAAGAGLNTAMFTYSGKPLTPVHDEIDFEFLGKSPGTVQLNYFVGGQGNHGSVPALGHDGSGTFTRIAFVWLPESIRWYVDGRLVREETGRRLPSTPGQFFLSLWSAGAPSYDWLGKPDPAILPALAQVDWVAFTKMGESCKFPQSITCQPRP